MAEFKTVFHDYLRMCNSFGDDCYGCLLENTNFCNEMFDETKHDLDNIEHIITSWAKNHPEHRDITWRNWLSKNGISVRKDGSIEFDNPNDADKPIQWLRDQNN